MKSRIASYLSYISHPVLLAFAGLYFLVNWHFVLDAKLSGRTELLFLSIFFMSLVLVPTIGIMLLLRKYSPSALSVLSDEERQVSISVMAILYLFMALIFDSLFIDRIIRIYFFSLALTSAAGFLAGRRFRISYHMLGWGALTALAMLISRFAAQRMDWLLFVLIILAGLTGKARLILKAHRPNEIYLGYSTGLILNLLFYGIIYGF